MVLFLDEANADTMEFPHPLHVHCTMGYIVEIHHLNYTQYSQTTFRDYQSMEKQPKHVMFKENPANPAEEYQEDISEIFDHFLDLMRTSCARVEVESHCFLHVYFHGKLRAWPKINEWVKEIKVPILMIRIGIHVHVQKLNLNNVSIYEEPIFINKTRFYDFMILCNITL